MKLPRWLEVWSPVAIVLSAMWTISTRIEDRLTARIDSLSDGVQRVESKVDELTGYVRGLHKLDLAEDR